MSRQLEEARALWQLALAAYTQDPGSMVARNLIESAHENLTRVERGEPLRVLFGGER